MLLRIGINPCQSRRRAKSFTLRPATRFGRPWSDRSQSSHNFSRHDFPTAVSSSGASGRLLGNTDSHGWHGETP